MPLLYWQEGLKEIPLYSDRVTSGLPVIRAFRHTNLCSYSCNIYSAYYFIVCEKEGLPYYNLKSHFPGEKRHCHGRQKLFRRTRVPSNCLFFLRIFLVLTSRTNRIQDSANRDTVGGVFAIVLQQNLASDRNDKVGAHLTGLTFNGNGSSPAKTNGFYVVTNIGKPKGSHVTRGNRKGLVGNLGWIQHQIGLNDFSFFLLGRNVLLDPFLNPQAMQRLAGITVGNKHNATAVFF